MIAVNRRSAPRACFGGQVQAVSAGGLHEVACHDISEGGACLQADGLRPKDTVKLFVPMPDRSTGRRRLCLLQGEVLWRRARAVGVRFVDPAPESVRQLRAFVARSA